MREERTVRKMSVATHMMRAMKRGIGVLAASALVLSFAACGDNDGDGDDGPCESGTSAALKAFPNKADGTLTLVFEGAEIEVDVTARSHVSESDECKLTLALEQDFNALCGEKFAGELGYSNESKEWEGTVVQSDAGEGESPIEIDVRYTLQENGQIEAWNHMDPKSKSSNSLCSDRVIEGILKP